MHIASSRWYESQKEERCPCPCRYALIRSIPIFNCHKIRALQNAAGMTSSFKLNGSSSIARYSSQVDTRRLSHLNDKDVFLAADRGGRWIRPCFLNHESVFLSSLPCISIVLPDATPSCPCLGLRKRGDYLWFRHSFVPASR